MKDRIYKVLDPSAIQQNQLRKPESPFISQPQQNNQNSIHQSVSRSGSYQHSSIGRKTSYPSPHTATTPTPHLHYSPQQTNLMQNTQSPVSVYTPNTISQTPSFKLPTPIVPIQAPTPLPTQDSGFFQPAQSQPAVETSKKNIYSLKIKLKKY